LYGKFYNKRPVATGLDRFFLRCGPIRTGPKRSGYGPLISGSVYTGCGCQLPRFEVKNRTRLDFKTLIVSGTIRYLPSKLMALDLLQINIHKGDRTTSDGVIPLMPNPSTRFTGRTEVITKLKSHFSNTNDSVQKRNFFLLHGMGGIGKTQICLKFIEEMSDW
jgi:hypothetical protein